MGFFFHRELMVLCVRSCVWLFVTPWSVASQVPLSVRFSRQEYWSGLPFPSSGDFSDPGTEPTSLECPALAGGFFTTSATWEAQRVDNTEGGKKSGLLGEKGFDNCYLVKWWVQSLVTHQSSSREKINTYLSHLKKSRGENEYISKMPIEKSISALQKAF